MAAAWLPSQPGQPQTPWERAEKRQRDAGRDLRQGPDVQHSFCLPPCATDFPGACPPLGLPLLVFRPPPVQIPPLPFSSISSCLDLSPFCFLYWMWSYGVGEQHQPKGFAPERHMPRWPLLLPSNEGPVSTGRWWQQAIGGESLCTHLSHSTLLNVTSMEPGWRLSHLFSRPIGLQELGRGRDVSHHTPI